MRKFLIAVPAFLLGGLAAASLTTVARAQAPARAKAYDYAVAYDGEAVARLGKMGYQIVGITGSQSGAAITWTMQRK